MSMYLSDGEAEPAFVASNTGWGDFGRWVDTLDPATYPDLVHLREHGWAEPAAAVRDQLDAAAKANKSDDPNVIAVVKDVTAALAEFADDAAVVASDGLTAGD